VSVTLFCGDCLEILPTLTGIGAVVTDPPYGIAYDTEHSTQQGLRRYAMLEGDSAPFDVRPFLQFPDALVWCRPQCTIGIPIGAGAWYAWDKVTKNDLKVRIGECEFAWHKNATKPRMFRHLWSGAYRASENGEASLHPTQKPVALMRWCIERLRLPEGATILDPYMGSGTTGIAAVQMGYNFIGCEIDPTYFEIAKRRIEQAQQQIAMPLEVVAS